jgi:cell division protein FtsQ
LKRPGSKPIKVSSPTAQAGTGKKRATVSPIRSKSAKKTKETTSKRALSLESKRLGKLRKIEGKRGIFSRLSPEARKFTAYSRRRKITFLTLSLSFGSLTLLVIATLVTPIMAVQTIQVEGIKLLKEDSVVNALKKEIGKPLPLVNAADVAESLKSFSLIESFSLVSLPPNTLLVRVSERQPIGVVQVSGTNYLYDPAGVRISIATGRESLPKILIASAPEESKEFKAAIEVLMALPANLLGNVSEINAKSKDDVVLALRGLSGQKIIWGDGSDSVLKSKVLEALIANQKSTDRVTYDVSSPNAPVVRYGNF